MCMWWMLICCYVTHSGMGCYFLCFPLDTVYAHQFVCFVFCWLGALSAEHMGSYALPSTVLGRRTGGYRFWIRDHPSLHGSNYYHNVVYVSYMYQWWSQRRWDFLYARKSLLILQIEMVYKFHFNFSHLHRLDTSQH